MAEYIVREALLREIERREALMVGDKLVSVDAMKSFIKNRPAADVAPVRHGEWEIVVGSNGNEYMVCTCCRVSQDLTGVFTYCPNCGAKMDLNDLED